MDNPLDPSLGNILKKENLTISRSARIFLTNGFRSVGFNLHKNP